MRWSLSTIIFLVVIGVVLADFEFFTLRAPRRGGDRESFRENSSKKSYFTNFSDAPDARGRRELPLVKISALNDPWRYQKRQKTKNKIGIVYGFGTQFVVIFIDFGGARLFVMSKSSSSRFFALDGQIFRSVRRLELIFGFCAVRTSTCGEIWALRAMVSSKSRNFLEGA